jgi:DNA repair protein RecO
LEQLRELWFKVNFQPKHTRALVLYRTDYAESDRIVTFLTKDYGRVRAIAKGVRKERGKLAAGVELFCVCEIGFIVGRSELATLVSAKLIKSYHHFLGNLNKVNFAYDSLKKLNKIIAEAADSQYFELVEKLLAALDEVGISLDITALWWQVNLTKLTGHSLNLSQTVKGAKLSDNRTYSFDKKHGGFVEDSQGEFKPEHIKFLRLAINYVPRTLARVKGADGLANSLNRVMSRFSDYHYQIGV